MKENNKNSNSICISNISSDRMDEIHDKIKLMLLDEGETVIEGCKGLDGSIGDKRIYIQKRDDNNDIGCLLENFIEVMKLLRSPNGCPWDKKQSHESLKYCLIEEAYEVINAINLKDREALKEELGDLLLQVVFHANIAEEENQFTMKDILLRVTDKMLYRHPHVFGDIKAKTFDEALSTWEVMKQKEKQIKTKTSSMQSIPKELPALMRSFKVQKKAAEVGFDWPNIKYAIDKIHEEVDEFLEAYASGNKEATEEELGDILFSVVNVARFLEIQPEEALSQSIEKFIFRFSYIESKATERGTILEDMSLEEMDKLWDEIKKI